MNIHEYQAKEIFRRFGVPVADGGVAFTPEEAEKVARSLKTDVIAVKAQIHAGGRGKAGGIKIVKTPEGAAKAARELIGKVLVTHQTGPQGKEVRKVLVEAGSVPKRELYLSVLIDRTISRPSFLASTEGGVDIEAVAAKTPEKILKEPIDPAIGMQPYQARKIAFMLGLAGNYLQPAVNLLLAVYRAFLETDASLIEINPLIIDQHDRVLALDAKMNFDDNALFRHKDIAAMRDLNEEDLREVEASKSNLNYIGLTGNIACMVNGAGLAMATMDIIKHYGGEPANFLDVGGGASTEQVTEAFKILCADKNVGGILVNIFGGIMKCDVIANGILTAVKQVQVNVPLVVRLEGTNVELGKRILKESGLAVIPADSMADAAQKIVGAASSPRPGGRV
ncbi:MAG TPA: ADP-forming succinate--CoA ligase subunit beta [Verrucomicrobiae bacterium]|nr:ADP-forming succinate--CoA ligase subunit beta [Verrucomicrobiae bacterium]